MEITWDIDDGYCGGSRPQQVNIPDDELAECETDEEKAELVDQYVQEDFSNTVSAVYENPFSK